MLFFYLLDGFDLLEHCVNLINDEVSEIVLNVDSLLINIDRIDFSEVDSHSEKDILDNFFSQNNAKKIARKKKTPLYLQYRYCCH